MMNLRALATVHPDDYEKLKEAYGARLNDVLDKRFEVLVHELLWDAEKEIESKPNKEGAA
jgi:hypothetical protein